MTVREFFSFRHNRFFWLNIIAMPVVLILILAGVWAWLDTYTRHGEAVVVPNVKGKSIVEAEKAFQNVGLLCVVSDSMYVKTLPPGCILDYNPALGQKVKKGRIIHLTINTYNIPLRPIPDVADNSSLREAEARLLASGFNLLPNDTVPGERDWVYGVKYQGQMLDADAAVPEGAQLALVVGDGKEHEEILPADSLEVLPTDSLLDTESIGAADESWFE